MFEKKQRAIFFDRDGVLNYSKVVDGKPYAPRELNEFVLYPGINSFIKRAKSLGFVTLVVTNQPDIGHGLLELETMEAMHSILKAYLDIDDIYFCPHRQSDECACRKPRTGMIERATNEFNLDLRRSWLIGDRITDIMTAEKAGINAIFIDRGYRESLDMYPSCKIVSRFASAMRYIFEFSEGS
ncbi:MAG: HAD-IIIA family hydrolase [Pseudomonadota bacterium]|nr:HAD-IIIA family hydrolase [Pseudomonadota bacterium]